MQKEWKTVGWLPSSFGTANAQRKWDIIPLRCPTPKKPPTTRTSSSSISPPTYSGLILNQPPFLVLGRYTESGFLTMIPSSLPSMASFRASAQSWLENKMFVPKNLIFSKYNYNVHVLRYFKECCITNGQVNLLNTCILQKHILFFNP